MLADRDLQIAANLQSIQI